MKKVIFKKKYAMILASVLIVAGIVGSAPELYFRFTNAGSVDNHGLPRASAASVNDGVPLVSGQPIQITIPSVKIDIPVINGYYNSRTKDWTLSLDKAQFATPTVIPNNHAGNTFIYGHYRVGVFYTLPHIKNGDEAYITTANGYLFKYKFYTTYATKPTDNSVLHYQGPPMLTLQTCSGSYYQNRQMYLFSYEGYTKVDSSGAINY